jgi:hypothetical protein
MQRPRRPCSWAGAGAAGIGGCGSSSATPAANQFEPAAGNCHGGHIVPAACFQELPGGRVVRVNKEEASAMQRIWCGMFAMAAADVGAQEGMLGAVSAALGDLLTHDRELLRLSAHELAMVHRFGVYLERRLQPAIDQGQLAIDLDYDRHGTGPKLLPGRPDKCGQRRFRPDLVVHHRGDDDQNLLVVEWKKKATNGMRARLKGRVESLLREDSYHYLLGVIVDSHDDGVRWLAYDSGGQMGGWRQVPASGPGEG